MIVRRSHLKKLAFGKTEVDSSLEVTGIAAIRIDRLLSLPASGP